MHCPLDGKTIEVIKGEALSVELAAEEVIKIWVHLGTLLVQVAWKENRERRQLQLWKSDKIDGFGTGIRSEFKVRISILLLDLGNVPLLPSFLTSR